MAKFRDYFPDHDLASISSEEVLSFLTSLNDTCKQLTKHTRYAYLKALFNFIRNNLDAQLQNPSPRWSRLTIMSRRSWRGSPGRSTTTLCLPYLNKPIVTPGGLKNSFITACGKAGILYGQNVAGGITFHDLRRTVKTNMLSAGMDKVYRDTILGHSLHGMDVHYMAPSEDDLHRAMDIFTAWLDAQIQGVAHFVAKVNESQ